MTSAFLSSPLANLSNRQLCPSKDRVARKQTHVNMKDENPVKVTAFPKPQKKNDPMCLLGPWTKHEHLAFLYGLRLYGPGRWKKIAELIPTRDNIQIKSHGQQVLKRCEKGVNIFDELDAFFYEQECQQARHSIVRTIHHGPMWNKHIGHRVQVGLMGGQSELRLRPPTDVIDAAFGLVKLSAAPRNVVTTFNKGTVHAVPRNMKKPAPLRY